MCVQICPVKANDPCLRVHTVAGDMDQTRGVKSSRLAGSNLTFSVMFLSHLPHASSSTLVLTNTYVCKCDGTRSYKDALWCQTPSQNINYKLHF